MNADWPVVNLGDVVELMTGFPFKSKEYSDDGNGYKLLRGDNIVQGKFRWEDVKRWPKSKIIEKHHIYWLKEGDVILAMDRPWIKAGLKYAQITETDLPCLLVQRTSCLRAKNGFDQDFLRYLISSYNFVEYVKLVQTGTAVPHISGKQILDFEFRLPPENVQFEIGRILRSLDNNIELNRQTNHTLEQIAQAIFKSWFVDLEPVKAKAQVRASVAVGRSPGYVQNKPLPKDFDVEAAVELAAICAISGQTEEQLNGLDYAALQQLKTTAAIFPDALVESELGDIPEGWVIAPLGEFLDVLETGRRPKGGVSGITEGVPSVGAENIIRIGRYNFGKEKFVSQDFFSKISSGIVESEDVLLYKDGGKPGEFKPRVSMFGYGYPYEIFAINEHVFRLRSDKLGQHYLYLQVSHENVLFDLRHKGGKAAIPGINQKDVRTVDILIPPDKLLNNFNSLIHPILVGILNSAKQNKKLTELRDSLLPKLLSGDITLDGSAFTSEAVA